MTGRKPPAAAPISQHIARFHANVGMAPQVEVPINTAGQHDARLAAYSIGDYASQHRSPCRVCQMPRAGVAPRCSWNAVLRAQPGQDEREGRRFHDIDGESQYGHPRRAFAVGQNAGFPLVVVRWRLPRRVTMRKQAFGVPLSCRRDARAVFPLARANWSLRTLVIEIVDWIGFTWTGLVEIHPPSTDDREGPVAERHRYVAWHDVGARVLPGALLTGGRKTGGVRTQPRPLQASQYLRDAHPRAAISVLSRTPTREPCR